jgi:2,3-bisphosphoglycerate-dependent phosphoglycerate mutase
MAKLFLVRHGESEWNEKGLWTGWIEVSLTEEGVKQAKKAGQILQNEKIDKIYASDMARAQMTMQEIKNVCGPNLECLSTPALKERSYGIYTGKNKWQVKKEIGEEAFQKLRRGWDEKIPEGETLKDVYERVEPYYEENIKKDLALGKNVLVVAHGNSLRALVKHLENLDERQVCEVELGTGEVHCYHLDENTKIIKKELLTKKI